MRSLRLLVLIVPVILSTLVLTSCGDQTPKTQLRVYNADSLIIPFQALEKQFEADHPNIDVVIEGHGSIQVIRAVTELGYKVDVAAVADNQLIPLLMYSSQIREKGVPYADWYIDFATNSLGIAYTDRSPYASEITADNWFDILARPDVKVGLADPRIDSLGYRALIALQLAQDHYQKSRLINNVLEGAFTMNLDFSTIDGMTTITVPQMLEPAKDRIILRSYTLQILALLESGDVDYSFEYQSVASQHGLKFLPLPPEVNLSNADYNSLYQKVSVKLDFQRFASVKPVFQGSPIVYAVTIPQNTKHAAEAAEFIRYLLGPEGRQTLNDNSQPPLVPAQADHAGKIPNSLMSLVK